MTCSKALFSHSLLQVLPEVLLAGQTQSLLAACCCKLRQVSSGALLMLCCAVAVATAVLVAAGLPAVLLLLPLHGPSGTGDEIQHPTQHTQVWSASAMSPAAWASLQAAQDKLSAPKHFTWDADDKPKTKFPDLCCSMPASADPAGWVADRAAAVPCSMLSL